MVDFAKLSKWMQDVRRLKLPAGKVVAIDTETTGLRPYHGDRAFCFSYATDLGEVGFRDMGPESIEWLNLLFSDRTRQVVGHNFKYDLTMFLMAGIDIFSAKCEFHCTLALSKLFNMNGDHDLGSVVERYLSRDDSEKTIVDDWLKQNNRAFRRVHGRAPNFSDVPEDLIQRRCMFDSESTLLIFKRLYPFAQRNYPSLYETERMLMLVSIDMEREGVLVDLTRTQQLDDEARQFTALLHKRLANLVGDITVQRKRKGQVIFEEVKAADFNPGSPQHMVGAFNKLGIPLVYKTKPKKKGKTGLKTGGGNWAFDEASMMKYMDPRVVAIARESSEEGWRPGKFYNELVKTVQNLKLPFSVMFPLLCMKIKELTKLRSTYYSYFLENAVDVHQDPRGFKAGTLHCKMNPFAADTGRFSSSDPNLQNQPRLLGPRECFVPRYGCVNLHADYEQVEMKFFVHFSRDEGMRQAIADDIHKYAAVRIYKISKDQVTKEQRKRAKSIGFGILYGARPKKLAETMSEKGLPTTLMEATLLFQNYHREFPSISKVTRDFELQLARDGFVTNPFGRRYHMSKKVAYKMLNYECQGTSADAMKAAMVRLWLKLRRLDIRARLIITVHDEIIIQVPFTELHIVVPLIKPAMEYPTQYFLPITVDVEVVRTRWSEKLDYAESGIGVPLDSN